MNLADLQKIVAAYHQKNVSDLTINGIDMFLMNANSLRHKAELAHNFEYCRCRATLSIDGVTGGDLSNAVIYDPPSTVTVASSDTDIPGTYLQLQTFNHFWAYELNSTYYIYFNTFYNSYVISDGLVDGQRAYVWTPASPLTNPSGTYTKSAVNATATLHNEFVKVREVVAVQRVRKDGRVVPIDFTRSDIPIERDRTVVELRDDFWPVERYPSDAQILARVSRATLIQRRDKIFIYPPYKSDFIKSHPLHVILEAYGQLPDWTTNDTGGSPPDPNFFLTNGFDWLKWAMVYELNPLFSTFVARQEGNVGNNPKEMLEYRENAWRDFIIWDTYQIDANSTRDR